MSYATQVIEYINTFDSGTPIYITKIAEILETKNKIEHKKALATASATIKYIVDKNLCPNLRTFSPGIYYLTTMSRFGETGIDKSHLVIDKYIAGNNGYITGYDSLYRLGLTTQIPNTVVIATNYVNQGIRKDQLLGVHIKKPKTKITAENKDYLKILDAMELMDRAPIDIDEPYKLLAKLIQKADLKYDMLLAIADKFYSKATLVNLARTATEGVLL